MPEQDYDLAVAYYVRHGGLATPQQIAAAMQLQSREQEEGRTIAPA